MKKLLLALSLFISASYAAENYQEYKLVFLVKPIKYSDDCVDDLYQFFGSFKGIYDFHGVGHDHGQYWERDGVKLVERLSWRPVPMSFQVAQLFEKDLLELPGIIPVQWDAVSDEASYAMAREAILSLKETKKYMTGVYLAKKGEHERWHGYYLDLDTGLLVLEEQECNDDNSSDDSTLSSSTELFNSSEE